MKYNNEEEKVEVIDTMSEILLPLQNMVNNETACHIRRTLRILRNTKYKSDWDRYDIDIEFMYEDANQKSEVIDCIYKILLPLKYMMIDVKIGYVKKAFAILRATQTKKDIEGSTEDETEEGELNDDKLGNENADNEANDKKVDSEKENKENKDEGVKKEEKPYLRRG